MKTMDDPTDQVDINLLPNELQYEIIDAMSLDELRAVFMFIQDPGVRSYAARRGEYLALPRGLRVTDEMIENVRRTFKYLKVQNSDGPIGHRTVSGISRFLKMANTSDNVYLPDLRLTGTPEDVEIVLRSLGYTPRDIDEIMADAITADNYFTHPEYLRELEEYNQSRRVR